MKTTKKKKLYKTIPGGGSKLRETMVVPLSIADLPNIGDSVGIRAAKAHLSALVAMVEKGKNLVLMRDGAPVAKLVPFEKPARKPFEIDEDFLLSQPLSKGPSATEIIRQMRDGRELSFT